VELASFVSEEEFISTWVEFKEINLRVMIDSSLHGVVPQILYADSHRIEQVSNDFGRLTSS